MTNLYEILQINKNATRNEIKKAYKKLILIYHPDKNHNVNSSNKFMEIKMAYDILMDPHKKNEYDVMSSHQQIELYDFFKEYVFSSHPIYEQLIFKFYDNEQDLKNDINSFNIKNIYNKFKSQSLNTNQDQDIILPIYDYNENDEKLHIPKQYTINIDLIDRYLNKFYKMYVGQEIYHVPLKDDNYIINDIESDITVNIICKDHQEFKQLNKQDLFIIKNISISEYFYGGKIIFDHMDDQEIIFEFTSCVDIIPIFCITNKGLKYNEKYGNLYVYLTIDGINSTNNTNYKEVIYNLFPPLN